MAPNTQQDIEKDSQSNPRSENLECTKFIIQDLLRKQVLLSNLEKSLPSLNPSKRKLTMNFKYENGDLGPLVAKRSKLEGTLIQEEPGVNQNSKSVKKSPLIGQVNLQSSLSNQTNGVDEKNTHIEVYDFMQLSSEKAIIFKIKNEPIDQEISLPSTNQENTLVKSETIDMKTNLKPEVKQENFGEFEAREQVGIDFITSKDFDYPFAKSELIKMKTEVKTEAKEQPFCEI